MHAHPEQPQPSEQSSDPTTPMIDVLTFDTLISIPVLLVFYYLGALVMPVVAWLAMVLLLRRFEPLDQAFQAGIRVFDSLIPLRWRLLILLVMLLMFVSMELGWRVMFEFLIAFMQMRDALVGAAGAP